MVLIRHLNNVTGNPASDLKSQSMGVALAVGMGVARVALVCGVSSWQKGGNMYWSFKSSVTEVYPVSDIVNVRERSTIDYYLTNLNSRGHN